MTKKIERHIPKLPLSAIIFYVITIVLWKLELIPDPREILRFLEELYNKYGYFGLVLATFLESIAYLGLYFPGSLIIALAVFFSDGSFIALLTISVLVAITLTITAAINYLLGRYISRKDFIKKEKFIKKSEILSKGLFVSMLHPNLLAFYFFNAGLERHHFKKLIYIPFFMIPYGYLFGLFLSKFSEPAKQGLENPIFLLTAILIWLAAAFVLENKKNKKRKLQEEIK